MAEQPRQQEGYDELAGGEGPGGRSATMTWGLRAFGLLMALLVWLAMGLADGLSSDARWVATIATLMAIWWMTEAIPLSATSLLPIGLSVLRLVAERGGVVLNFIGIVLITFFCYMLGGFALGLQF